MSRAAARPVSAPGVKGTRALALFAFVLATWLTPIPARAHEIRPTIATIELASDGAFTLGLSINLESLIAAVGPDHRDSNSSPNAGAYNQLRLLPPEGLARAYADFAPKLRDGIVITDEHGATVTLTADQVLIGPVGDVSMQRTSTVSFAGHVPPGAELLRWRFNADFGPSAIRAKPKGGDIFFSDYVLNGDASGDIGIGHVIAQSMLSVIGTYLQIGYEHIVPKGLDHILFVVGLFLLSPKLKPILWQVTCFTVAHTLTLALGMLGLVRVPGSIVEPLVALSIVYVGIENMRTDHLTRWRPLVVFLFGLLHGLGFAGILQEIGLAPADFLIGLISFNVGVELGQLTVVAGCFLAVGIWFSDRPWYRNAVTLPASFAIAAIAGFWFIERVT